ncbi:MAG: HsmA family protein [Candidatus Thorarchaeota archaeon]
MYFVTAALITYSIAVWGEQLTNDLKPAFVIMFCIGVICDATGTLMMFFDMQAGGSVLGLFDTIFHIVTGLTAILLMFIHAMWAIRVLRLGDEESAAKFHRFSKFVWAFWLIPFLSPMISAMLSP